MDCLLKSLVNAFGVSGREEAVRQVIKEELKDTNCEIREDKMGNIIVKMGAGEERIMFCAHMDQIGVIATYIEDCGMVRVGSIGDFKPEDMKHNFVEFSNGVVGKLCASKENPSIGDMYIDLGLNSREEVLKLVKEGDTGRFVMSYNTLGGKEIGPNFDDRIGCYALLRMIKEIKDTSNELYFVFSTQKELGGRGARAAAYSIEPDYCIVVDVEGTGDVPGAKGSLKLGEGPIVSIINRTLILDSEVKEMIEKAAEGAEVKLQYSISTENTDGGLIHKEVGGIKTGVVSIPCRYLHTVSEMISMEDVEKTIKVLMNLI